MSKEPPLVTLIIPNYNGSKYLRRYLRSVFNTKYPNLEIIFVDDGSKDDSINVVKDISCNDPRLKIIKHERNLGLAYARNTGIKAGKGEIIAFVDNDIEVDPNWLVELVKALLRDEKIGVAMSKTYDMKSRNRLQCFGQLIIPYIGWTISIGYGMVNGRIFEKVREIYGCLNAVAIKRSVFERIGLIDTDMTYLWEDIDFEYRVWLAGYKEVVVPTSKVFHYAKPPGMREKTYRWRRFRKDFLSRNFIYFMLKNYELKTLIKYFPIAFLIHSLRCVISLLRSDFSSFWSLVEEIVWVLRNFPLIINRRRSVQKTRILRDDLIFSKVGMKSLADFLKYRRYTKLALNRYFLW